MVAILQYWLQWEAYNNVKNWMTKLGLYQGQVAFALEIIMSRSYQSNWKMPRDAGTGGGEQEGQLPTLGFCWEGQGGQKCPLSIKTII